MERRKFVTHAGSVVAGAFMIKPLTDRVNDSGIHPFSDTSNASDFTEALNNTLPLQIFDIRKYGAKGDGLTKDTKAIQAAIDACHQKGGGRVILQNGRFLSGTIYLKSNVCLFIEAGATLLGSDQVDDFPITSSKYPSYTGEYVTNKMLVYAEDASNITICGRGTIDGRGDDFDGPYLSPSFSGRPRIIHFRGCNNIQVRDVTLSNSGSWVQSYQSSKNILIDGITVDSRENPDIEKPRQHTTRHRNTDGLDLVDCEQVRISNCFINSGDDAICLKSFSQDEACRDITITNCVLTCHASGIKIGTESAGAFEDITVQNCIIYDNWADAIAILTADGARVERVNISNISLRNIKGAAIAIRLGLRFRPYRKKARFNEPVLKDVIIENILGERISHEYGCSIRGSMNYPVENISLRNIHLEFEGGGKAYDSYREVPEEDRNMYPSGRHFGTVPAYGFYIRHARHLTLENIRTRFKKQDHRPAIIGDNVEHFEVKGLKAQATPGTPELIRLINARETMIYGSRSLSSVPVFLRIEGEKTRNIYLVNNILNDAEKRVVVEDETLKNTVSESGTIQQDYR